MNLEVLNHILDNAPETIAERVQGTGHDPDAAVGVGKLLLGNGGNIDALSKNQRFYYDNYIKSLLEDVPCDGILGDPEFDSCTGTGDVDDESLLLSYQEDRFLCQHCRFDLENKK